MDELTEICLSADEAEGNTLLSAESGQVNDELNWVDVVSDDDHLGFVLFDEGRDVVETKLDVHRLLSLLFVSSLGLSLQSKGLLLVGLRLILSKQFKKLGSYRLLINKLIAFDWKEKTRPLSRKYGSKTYSGSSQEYW